jgi:hypothetical protein
MRLRTLALGVLVLGLTAGTSGVTAGAAAPKPKPVCNLVTDPEGDGTHHASGLSSPMLDIKGVDVATNGKKVAAILRLKSLTMSSTDVLTQGQIEWSAYFQISGTSYEFTYTKTTGPNPAYSGKFTAGNSTVTPKVEVNVSAATITWSVDRGAVANLKRPKQTLVQIGGTTSWMGGNADGAGPSAKNVKYPDLYPSCLKIPA